MADGESWGHLLCTTETKSPIRLGKKTIRIGRTSDCDISFLGNKLISGRHCAICHDEEGKTWLTDTSTNGTLINGRKVKKGEKVEIHHNDQIHLIHRKNQPDDDIAYIFQDLKCLKEECDLLDSTQEYNAEDVTGTPEMEDQKNLAKRPLADVSGQMQPEAKKPKQDAVPESKQESGSNKKSKSHSHDPMGDTLTCGICQDIFHDCLSLQPCMHSFCSSCYSQWMDRSNECPTCRLPVGRMSRNHIVNNLVEAYLIENPGRRRPAEELAEMDAKNKITADMVRPKKKKERELFEDDSDDSERDSSDEDEEDDEDNPLLEFGSPLAPSSFGSLFGFTPNEFRPPPTVCRWCPAFRPTTLASSVGSNQTSSDGASGDDLTSCVIRPVCPPRMVHLMCLCCMQPMPKQEDLPTAQAGNTYAKSQKCGVCTNFYCHLLWKCNKLGCRGCLNEFQGLDFDDNCLDALILNNKYESQILKNYLDEKGWSLKELLGKCLEKLDEKEYTTLDSVTYPELDSKYILCYRCGLRNFKELAYQFRQDIPKEDLPAAITTFVSRQDSAEKKIPIPMIPKGIQLKRQFEEHYKESSEDEPANFEMDF